MLKVSKCQIFTSQRNSQNTLVAVCAPSQAAPLNFVEIMFSNRLKEN